MPSVPRGLIGVIHLLPLPGDPRTSRGIAWVREQARRDATAYVEGGADALIVENFGSAPFVKGTGGDRIPPHQLAAIALVADDLVRTVSVPVGINCLRNDAYSALGVAACTGASFVRVNVHVGVYATDQGIIEGEAALSLRYREALSSGTAILADVLVKHASPLGEVTIEAAVGDALERGLADGVIVTGAATGAAVDPQRLRRAREAAGPRPLFLGSGLVPELAADLAPLCEGAIVGTYCKTDGDVTQPVDTKRVRKLVSTLRSVRQDWGQP